MNHIIETLRHLAVPLRDLVVDPKNARKHDERNLEVIERSLSRWGQRLPIVVQKSTNIVRAGNGRVLVARKLGWEHVAAIIVDESDTESAAFAIADNRSAELADWDWTVLREVLQDLSDTQIDLGDVGFSTDDVSAIVASWEPPQLPEDSPEDFGSPEDTFKLQAVWSAEQSVVIRKACGLAPDAVVSPKELAGHLLRVCEEHIDRN